MTATVLAAEFVNDGKRFRAVRYQHADGKVEFYTPEGKSLRKAFLKAPVQFSRISSVFNPRRKHPVLNTHPRAQGRGLRSADAARRCVPRAPDACSFRGVKGGYGNVVEIEHAGQGRHALRPSVALRARASPWASRSNRASSSATWARRASPPVRICISNTSAWRASGSAEGDAQIASRDHRCADSIRADFLAQTRRCWRTLDAPASNSATALVARYAEVDDALCRPDLRHQHGRRGIRAARHRAAAVTRCARALHLDYPDALVPRLSASWQIPQPAISIECGTLDAEVGDVFADCAHRSCSTMAGSRRLRRCVRSAVTDRPYCIALARRVPSRCRSAIRTGSPNALGIDVVADFRRRDMAAGGEGAPLVPAFHAAAFAAPGEARVVVEHRRHLATSRCWAPTARVSGFDTGPGNCLMDLWATEHLGRPYDRGRTDGGVGAGAVLRCCSDCCAEPYLAAPATQEHGPRTVPSRLAAAAPRGPASWRRRCAGDAVRIHRDNHCHRHPANWPPRSPRNCWCAEVAPTTVN